MAPLILPWPQPQCPVQMRRYFLADLPIKPCWMSTYLMPADSMYGHVAKLAEKVKAGLDTVPGIKATIYRVR